MREVLVDGRPAAVSALLAAIADMLAGSGPAVLPLDANHPRLATLRAAMAPGEPVEPDTALIVMTSGSTGDAKGVLLSAAALRASAEATHARLGGPGRWLLATPAQYIGGIQVLVRSVLAGYQPEVVDLSVPFRAASFAAAAREALRGCGPHYTALVPTQLGQLLDEGGSGLAALSAFDAVLIGAAAMPARLRERAEQAGVRVVPTYGMTETASGCVYDGSPIDGVGVRLANTDGDGVGRIELSGPVLAHGYRRRPELTERAFVAGWYRTGDAGRLRADGRLEILGRTDDLINTGGIKVGAALVERALLAHPAVRAACVLGVPDARWGQAVVAAVVARDSATPPGEHELRDTVRAIAGKAAVPKRFEFVDHLPSLGPGKIDRVAVQAIFAGHS